MRVKNSYGMDQRLSSSLTLAGRIKRKLLNVETGLVWHHRCLIQVKSFSSIFPFKTPQEPRKGLLSSLSQIYTSIYGRLPRATSRIDPADHLDSCDPRLRPDSYGSGRSGGPDAGRRRVRHGSRAAAARTGSRPANAGAVSSLYDRPPARGYGNIVSEPGTRRRIDSFPLSSHNGTGGCRNVVLPRSCDPLRCDSLRSARAP